MFADLHSHPLVGKLFRMARKYAWIVNEEVALQNVRLLSQMHMCVIS